MGRFYKTTEQEFLDPDKMVYKPDYNLSLKMIMQKEQQYKELETIADSIYNIQFNHLNSKEDEETARIQKQYFQERADDLVRQLQSDPNNLSNIQAKLKGLQREFTESKTKGQIAALENSYNAYHIWNKENSKLCEENPALCQAMRNEAMRNWGGDSLKRTWSQEKMTRGIDMKEIEQAIQKFEADIWSTAKETPSGKYIVKVGGEEKILSKGDIRNYAVNTIMSNPEYVHHMRQSDRVGISRYLNPDGTINPAGELSQKLQALNSYAYRQHKDLYEVREDKFALKLLDIENQIRKEKNKKALENTGKIVSYDVINEHPISLKDMKDNIQKILLKKEKDLTPQQKVIKNSWVEFRVNKAIENLNNGSYFDSDGLKYFGINAQKLQKLHNNPNMSEEDKKWYDEQVEKLKKEIFRMDKKDKGGVDLQNPYTKTTGRASGSPYFYYYYDKLISKEEYEKGHKEWEEKVKYNRNGIFRQGWFGSYLEDFNEYVNREFYKNVEPESISNTVYAVSLDLNNKDIANLVDSIIDFEDLTPGRSSYEEGEGTAVEGELYDWEIYYPGNTNFTGLKGYLKESKDSLRKARQDGRLYVQHIPGTDEFYIYMKPNQELDEYGAMKGDLMTFKIRLNKRTNLDDFHKRNFEHMSNLPSDFMQQDKYYLMTAKKINNDIAFMRQGKLSEIVEQIGDTEVIFTKNPNKVIGDDQSDILVNFRRNGKISEPKQFDTTENLLLTVLNKGKQ